MGRFGGETATSKVIEVVRNIAPYLLSSEAAKKTFEKALLFYRWMPCLNRNGCTAKYLAPQFIAGSVVVHG